MKYTLTEDDGVTIVRAELRTTNDFDELIKKLVEYRDALNLTKGRTK